MSAPRTVGREAVPATLIDLAARKVALIESVGRMVRIDYPKRIPPGWGRHPGLATAIGLASLLAVLFVARILFPPMADRRPARVEPGRRPRPPSTPSGSPPRSPPRCGSSGPS